MSYKFFAASLTLFCWTAAYSQPKIILENIKTGRQKEIVQHDRIRVLFSTRYEHAKVYQQGKLVSITDSTLSYKMSFRKDTVTVAFRDMLAIQKFNAASTFLLAGGIGALAGIVIPSSNPAQVRDSSPTVLLVLLGAVLAYNGLHTLVYPIRKVNRADTTWKIRTAR